MEKYMDLIYLEKNQLNCEVFGRGFTWLDMGTFDSLIEAQSFVSVLQNKQGFKIACIEEISLYKNWIKDENINILSKRYKNEYGKYLKSLIKENIS